MAFKNSNLSVLAYANGFTVWHYIAREKLKDVRKKGYFRNMADVIRDGDMVILNTKEEQENKTSFKQFKLNEKQEICLRNL